MTTSKKQQNKTASPAKKASAKKAVAKKTPAKKAPVKKAVAKKQNKPALVKIEKNVVKIDDIIEIKVDPVFIESVNAQKKSLIKKFFSFLSS